MAVVVHVSVPPKVTGPAQRVAPLATVLANDVCQRNLQETGNYRATGHHRTGGVGSAGQRAAAAAAYWRDRRVTYVGSDGMAGLFCESPKHLHETSPALSMLRCFIHRVPVQGRFTARRSPGVQNRMRQATALHPLGNANARTPGIDESRHSCAFIQ